MEEAMDALTVAPYSMTRTHWRQLKGDETLKKITKPRGKHPGSGKWAEVSPPKSGLFLCSQRGFSMEVEQKQAQVIEHFVKQASSLQGSSLVNLIVHLTSHSFLFAFSKILAVPNVLELQGTRYVV
ncbi:hypothetical protein DVH24_029068 [Malus domestica]|uniref:Uncharacterized protein n=1 Tax=Malus domestica TaxID=3750 RepID=A0A498HXQ0_MALDO|nr:hypothetical protein DVH24_029068 [Malus domestica]